MASSININQNNNDITLQDNNRSISITDNNTGTTINVTQPVTNVVTVATLGPQGPQGQQGPIGPIPTSGSFTGSFSGSFTGSLQGTASYALTASYLQGYISPFPYTGSARITGSLGVTGSISTTTQFYHPDSLNSSNRTLTDQNTNTSIDWGNRWLFDGNGSTINIQWDDTDTFGITTIPIIENFNRERISDELQYTYDSESVIVSGKILDRPFIEEGLSDGTLVYYNKSNDQWENFPQSSVSFPDNYLTGSLGIVCNDRLDVLLEGTITAIVNSADPTASLGPIIIGTPSIGSPLFAAGSLSNPTTDTVFSTQSAETIDDTVRILGHVIGEKQIEGVIRGYLIYFNPSNDFYKLTSSKQISAINGRNISAAYAIQATSAFTSSFAATSSYLNTLNQNLTFNGNLTLNGTASISNLVVNQTQYSSGSNQLGDAANDTQTLYGTVVIPTGSLTVTGSVRSTGGFTGSLFGTSSYATQALSSSFTQTASFVQNAQSASYVLLAQTSSLALRASGSLTGSLLGTATTASYVLNAQTASFVQQAVSSSFATTASYVNTLNQNVSITGSLNVSGSTNTDSIYFNTSTSSLRLSNDVRNWSLTNKNFSVATQEGTPQGIYFKNDGTRFYVIGTTADSIFQYDLSTAWDVTTAVYNSVSLNVSARDSGPIDTFISPDGLILYLAGGTNDAIYRYNLPTAWDLTGATFLNSGSVVAQDTVTNGLYFKPDGTKMYTVGATNDAVYEYNLGTAWDLTTVSFLQSFSLSSFETNSSAISFNDAGTRMYVLGTTGDNIIEFRLSTPWNISTAVYFSTSFTFTTETAPGGLYYNETNQVAYVVGTTLDTVYGLSTTPQLTYFGNSFAIDTQMYVSGRFETYGEAYINGALTTPSTATIGSTLTAPATSISTTSTNIGNSTGGYTINIGGAATSTGITAALASSSIGIGNAGAAGSQKILTIGNGTTGSLNNITIGSGRLLTPTTYLTSSAAEIYSYGSLYNYRTLQVGNNIVGDVELPNGNIVFYDAFTEVSTTELTLHTPNTGSNWQRIYSGSTAATISVRGGLGQSGPTSTIANSGSLYVASASMSTPNYEVKFTMAVQTSADDNIWLAARILDFNNFYAVKWSTTAANCILYKKVAGVWTALGTAGYSYAGTNIDLSLRVVGNNIFVINAGRLILSTTDSSITGSGFAGYGAGNLGAVATDDLSNVWEIKNFTVTEYNITNSKSYIERGNFGIGTTNPSASLHVSGSTRIDNVLTLTPQNPLPTGVPTGSFAVSSSIPPKPYFWDGSTWNALY
jgi:sugar lactone lactonase YvrE